MIRTIRASHGSRSERHHHHHHRRSDLIKWLPVLIAAVVILVVFAIAPRLQAPPPRSAPLNETAPANASQPPVEGRATSQAVTGAAPSPRPVPPQRAVSVPERRATSRNGAARNVEPNVRAAAPTGLRGTAPAADGARRGAQRPSNHAPTGEPSNAPGNASDADLSVQWNQ